MDRTNGERDISSPPWGNVDKEIDAFIERRHDQRVKEEGERPAEAPWVESERRAKAERGARLRKEWAEFHADQIRRIRIDSAVRIAHHEQQAERLSKGA